MSTKRSEFDRDEKSKILMLCLGWDGMKKIKEDERGRFWIRF